MPVPAFAFTSRAVPVAQIGRPEPLNPLDVTWADIGCDVHEITTDTGRGSMSDRFVPGTAVITASNVSGWADGTVPIEWSYFADEFARTGPALGSNWLSWPALEAHHSADMLVIDDEAAEVQARPVGAAGPELFAVEGGATFVDSYSAAGSTLSTTCPIGPFPGVAAGDLAFVALAIHTADTGTVNIPGWTRHNTWFLVGAGWRAEVWEHRITAEEAALGVPWTATWSLSASWNWVGFAARGVGSYDMFGGLSAHWVPGMSGYYRVGAFDLPSTTPSDGCVVARFAGGNLHHDLATSTGVVELSQSSGAWGATMLVAFSGSALPIGTPVPQTTWNWAAPAAVSVDEWSIGQGILLLPGPVPNPESMPMEGASCALWGLGYYGDQFVDVTMSGMAAPQKVWPGASTTVELILGAYPDSAFGEVAVVEWVPAWDDPDDTGTLSWKIDRRLSDGDWQPDDPFAEGDVTFGAAGLPDPVRIRFELDEDGDVRLYFQGSLLGSGHDPTRADGTHVGIHASYYAGSLSYGRTVQPGPPAFESVVGGANIPVPILLEPGVRVRVGVHHETHGYRWFFHGYVDGIVPVYDPERPAVSRIECIDALGEVGRLSADGVGGYEPEEAWQQVTRLLDGVAWPDSLADVADDATLMTNVGAPDRMVELLTHTAESSGGTVYGDPQTGRLVYHNRDWNAWNPDDPPDGYIGNGDPAGVALVACPMTWERAWKREEMTTRITYRSGYGDEYSYSNPDAEARFGIEPYARTLVCIEPRILDKLGRRQLRLRGPGAFPRVAAVLLDAATSTGALDVMTVSTFTAPSRYRCVLNRPDGLAVFDRQYLVTGVRHTMTRDRWQCRLALDAADVFATKGARWGIGHWGRSGDVWGRSI